MNRRSFLRGSLHAAMAGPLAASAFAQTPPAGRGAAGQAPRPAAPAPTTAAAPRKLVLDAHSRNLQWLRTADELGAAAVEMVCGGVCVTVQPFPGHVDPARAAQELPAFAKQVRSHGVRVTQIQGPAIASLSDAQADALAGAAAQAGCTHYTLGGFTYDWTKPLPPQLDAVKLRIEKLVRVSEKHRITCAYAPVAGVASVGGPVLDLLPILKLHNPRYIGLHWDTGHMALHADGMWEALMRHAGPYIASIGWRDRGWVQDLGLLGEGGPYAGQSPRVEPLVTQPDGSAVPGTPGAAAPARGAAPGGRAGGGAAAGGRGGGAGGGRGAGGAGGEGGDAGGGGRGPARGPANSAGAGSIDANNPLYRSLDGEMPKRPIGGKNAKGGGWSAPSVAMGTGMVDIPKVVTVLAALGFNGPSELQSEYAGLGGAERGADKVDRPRQFVLGMLKRDVITIRKSFEMANTGLSI